MPGTEQVAEEKVVTNINASLVEFSPRRWEASQAPVCWQSMRKKKEKNYIQKGLLFIWK